MKVKYILSIDQSTSATKAIIFNNNGKLINRVNVNHKQYYPKFGWVEQNPEEIYSNTIEAIKGVISLSNLEFSKISIISITNQRESVIIWDKQTGKPVHNVVVWSCTRAKDICEEINKLGCADIIKKKTGLILSPYFSAAKAKWILDNIPGVRKKAENGDLLMGTMDSWLIWNLTGGAVHATDFSNACRTQLFNINSLTWDKDLLEIFSIPDIMLPKIKSSDSIFGYTTIENIARNIPISGVMGDSHAALFGQRCIKKGMAKVTYGTGSSVMMNIGYYPLESKNGIVTSLAWKIGNVIEYVFEANIISTGGTIKWLIEDLQLISNPQEVEKIASSVESSGGVYFVPAFSGLAAPYWDDTVKALISGITRGTRKAHFIRAAEESIAYQVRDVLDLMQAESRIKLKELRVDGGPTRDCFLMQFQADILDTIIIRSEIEEVSAYGSALVSGDAIGIFKNKIDTDNIGEVGTVFKSKMKTADRCKLYKGWKEAIKRACTKMV